MKTIKIMILKSVVSLLLVFSSVASFASKDVASESSLVELMRVLDMEGVAATALKPKPEQLNKFSDALFKQGNLTETQKREVKKIFSEYLLDIANQMNTSENRMIIVNSFKAAAKKYYSQTEVDAQIKFYSSPVGKKIIKKQNFVIQEYSQAMSKAVKQKQVEVMKKSLKVMLKKLQALQLNQK